MVQAVLDTLHMGLRIKKTPVIVGNCTGFAVNRVFFPYTMAACLLADLGADIYLVDKIIKAQFGMPMGPFRLTDLVRPPLPALRHCLCLAAASGMCCACCQVPAVGLRVRVHGSAQCASACVCVSQERCSCFVCEGRLHAPYPPVVWQCMIVQLHTPRDFCHAMAGRCVGVHVVIGRCVQAGSTWVMIS